VTGVELVAFLALGAAAGTLAGLLGIGGGIIIVPGLAAVLVDAGVPPQRLMQVAVGTSLATIIATALASIHAHHRRGAVHWPLVARLAPGVVAGALVGTAVADGLATRVLAMVFGIFLIAVAVRLAGLHAPAPQRRVPARAGLIAWGSGIGGVSSLLGIGGGTLTVPFLTWCNIGVREAVATSAALGLPIAVAGTLGFIAMGWGHPDLPPGSTGYVYWPAWLAITPATIAFAPVGARLAHTIPTTWLKRAFALFVFIVGLRMLIG